jgi:hypothetical protein
MIALLKRSIFGSNLHPLSQSAEKSGNIEIRFSEKCRKTRVKSLRLLELGFVLVRFDHITSFIINPNHSIM